MVDLRIQELETEVQTWTNRAIVAQTEAQDNWRSYKNERADRIIAQKSLEDLIAKAKALDLTIPEGWVEQFRLGYRAGFRAGRTGVMMTQPPVDDTPIVLKVLDDKFAAMRGFVQEVVSYEESLRNTR